MPFKANPIRCKYGTLQTRMFDISTHGWHGRWLSGLKTMGASYAEPSKKILFVTDKDRCIESLVAQVEGRIMGEFHSGVANPGDNGQIDVQRDYYH